MSPEPWRVSLGRYSLLASRAALALVACGLAMSLYARFGGFLHPPHVLTVVRGKYDFLPPPDWWILYFEVKWSLVRVGFWTSVISLPLASRRVYAIAAIAVAALDELLS
jgi:hypothetical protein